VSEGKPINSRRQLYIPIVRGTSLTDSVESALGTSYVIEDENMFCRQEANLDCSSLGAAHPFEMCLTDSVKQKQRRGFKGHMIENQSCAPVRREAKQAFVDEATYPLCKDL
jgi:hypothetical protein